ncbi:MAG: hypothetical protein E3K37_02880 [Candidatus Kuenenia sp.]|nr:hypothetical protein [Candidatus Kuenenia hertensis]
MGKKDKKRVALIIASFAVFISVLSIFSGGITSGKDIEEKHTTEYAPIRSLMYIISSHTANILEAIMMGDYDSVKSETDIVIEKSEGLLKSFFPEGEPVGKWIYEFDLAGIDPNNPTVIKAIKEDVEKYINMIKSSAKNIAESSMEGNIDETYNNFDLMLRETCFKCHETYRSKWPEWPEWMQISGG